MMFTELPSGRPEPALDDYVRRAMLEIDGWGVDLYLAPILRAIDRFQKLNGISGNLFELGVHHGRCAVLLALMARADETAVFLDLFERQAENIDASGRGSREIVERNLETWAVGRRVEIIQANSLELDFGVVPGLKAGVRLAHIDGGHYREIVLNDLAKTEAVLVDGGVVIVDDFLHAGFPEVKQGCLEYLQRGATRLVPIAAGYNKLVMAARGGHEQLYGFLERFGETSGQYGGHGWVLDTKVVRIGLDQL
jgi:predicted O-methyltransferase YrrM